MFDSPFFMSPSLFSPNPPNFKMKQKQKTKKFRRVVRYIGIDSGDEIDLTLSDYKNYWLAMIESWLWGLTLVITTPILIIPLRFLTKKEVHFEEIK